MSAREASVCETDSGDSSTISAFAVALDSGRESLTRVLAREGRNALARVELVASELDRFESPPSVRERLATILEAVEEIDSLLAKIAGLSGETIGRPMRSTPIASVWAEVIRRMGPVLRVRGVALEADPAVDGLVTGVGASALEAILLADLRLALLTRPRASRLTLRVERCESCLRIGLVEAAHPLVDSAVGQHHAGDANAAGLVELELLVVESGGRLEPADARREDEPLPALLLPLGSSS